jgi:hypothetical protein
VSSSEDAERDLFGSLGLTFEERAMSTWRPGFSSEMRTQELPRALDGLVVRVQVALSGRDRAVASDLL